MRKDVHLAYVQARLQARHGDRLSESGWQAIEASRLYGVFLERARATWLARFLERIGETADAHMVELHLREARRRYVLEIAAMMLPPWQAATAWTRHLPELPILSRLVLGDKPALAMPWLDADPLYRDMASDAGLVGSAPPKFGSSQPSPASGSASQSADKRREALERHGLGALWPLPEDERSQRLQGPHPPQKTATATEQIYQHWLDEWHRLWPSAPGGDVRQLDAFVNGFIEAAREESEVRSGRRSVRSPRLDAFLERQFRAGRQSPIAVFAHLGLVALDIERLRGGLVRRLLLPAAVPEDDAA